MAIEFNFGDFTAAEVWDTYESELKVLPRIEGYKFTNAGDTQGLPVANSTPPKQLNSPEFYIRYSLNATYDHLHALATYVNALPNLDMLHVTAPYSLIRGALEALSQAAWICDAPDTWERRIRAAVLHEKEERYSIQHNRAYVPWRPSATAGPEDRSARESLSHVQDLPVFTHTSAIKVLDVICQAEGDGFEIGPHAAWCAASGFAHSFPWASYMYLGPTKQNIGPTAAGNTEIHTFTGNAGVLLTLCDTTIRSYNIFVGSLFNRNIVA